MPKLKFLFFFIPSWETSLFLFNVLHHETFNFINLSLHLRKLAYLFRVLNIALHMLLQLGPAASTNQTTYNLPQAT
ncbi:hypothetical protein LR48_Vigan05g061100 [Vigna angularis]|uniref:Uncharacterized protein n=1 Tax=Phaseolus angularis TaxID=3914 RepID=A0A0L9UKC5_PHAAN|nr:hypothetical protein LR48_Vigan05g061100 [Vigna angularis]